MFENSGELVILALAVIVAFLIATARAEIRLAEMLRAEKRANDADESLIDFIPPRLTPVDDQTVRVISSRDLRAIA